MTLNFEQKNNDVFIKFRFTLTDLPVFSCQIVSASVLIASGLKHRFTPLLKQCYTLFFLHLILPTNLLTNTQFLPLGIPIWIIIILII